MSPRRSSRRAKTAAAPRPCRTSVIPSRPRPRWPQPLWRRIWRRRFSRRRCRITSATPGPGQGDCPTLRMLQLVTSGALAAIVDIAEGLEVDAARMRVNLDATRGLIMAEAVTMALAEKIGKSEAHHLGEAASKKAVAEKKGLREVLTKDSKVAAHLDAGR